MTKSFLDLNVPYVPASTNINLGLGSFANFTSNIKSALLGLRLLAIESPLKMMKDAFYFTTKALFVLKIFKLLS